MKNYYEILEVDKNATKEIIKAVYKIHIKKKHPDLFQGQEKKKAEEQLKIINEAYETLSNDEKRNEYDKVLEENEREKKALLEELLQENALLKELVDKKKYEEVYEQNEIGINDNNYQFEYIQDPDVTEKNNTKYLMKLIWKERLLKTIIFITLVVAGVGAIHKLTGINILSSIFKALVMAIFGE